MLYIIIFGGGNNKYILMFWSVKLMIEAKDDVESIREKYAFKNFAETFYAMIDFFKRNERINLSESYDVNLSRKIDKSDKSLRNWLGAIEKDYLKKSVSKLTLVEEKLIVLESKIEAKSKVELSDKIQNETVINEDKSKEIETLKRCFFELTECIEEKKDMFGKTIFLKNISMDRIEDLKDNVHRI